MITTGNKYEETHTLTTTEIAKLVRADIKAAVKAGTLPAERYISKANAGETNNDDDMQGMMLQYVARRNVTANAYVDAAAALQKLRDALQIEKTPEEK